MITCLSCSGRFFIFLGGGGGGAGKKKGGRGAGRNGGRELLGALKNSNITCAVNWPLTCAY